MRADATSSADADETRSSALSSGISRVATELVGIFGGSFNPPHVGHVLSCAYALAVQPLDRVLVLPVHHHRFHKELAPFEHRLRMAELAMHDVAHVTVSSIERELDGEGRTLDTLEALSLREPSWSMRLIVGADVLAERDKWHRFDRVIALAPLIVLGRTGFRHADAPPPILADISSTAIRNAFATGDRATVATYVPHRVLEYIDEHGLYPRRELTP
ncbi:MAG: nicotinate (nicotinamide) nucleotide adenylyltransferase [Myxococcales bacterium]|nr:nicotinate (nicotinamide) nucleotide adenylyltransferase [Myxococcales bacterium]